MRTVTKQGNAWRKQRATPEQLTVLRMIATETGKTFATTVSRGEASERIEARFNVNPKAARAHEKAERKRRQAEQRLVNPAANWRFGDHQTPEQEQAEIRRAKREGLGEVYVALQTWVAARRSDGTRPQTNRRHPSRPR